MLLLVVVVVLQVEVSQLKEAHAAAVAEAAAAQEEVEALRSALRTVETRLVEYQHKDAEVQIGHENKRIAVILVY